MTASDGASNVIKMTSILTVATEFAANIASKANAVSKIVNDVIEKADEALMKLMKKAAEINAEEVINFQSALQETQSSGKVLEQRCSEIKQHWDSFNAYICELFKQQQIGKSEVQGCIRLLEAMVSQSEDCKTQYTEFKEKLNLAIEIGCLLAKRCQVAAQDARSKAVIIKGGFVYGALRAAALGFLLSVTGGIGATGAVAAAGALSVGAVVLNYSRARELDKLATELSSLERQLASSLEELNELDHSIASLFKVTEEMAKNIEIALKIFKEMERLRQENEKMNVEIMERQMMIDQRNLEAEAELPEGENQQRLVDRLQETNVTSEETTRERANNFQEKTELMNRKRHNEEKAQMKLEFDRQIQEVTQTRNMLAAFCVVCLAVLLLALPAYFAK